MNKITHTDQRLEFDKQVSPGARVVIFLAGLFPLIAPYELLIKIRWESFFNLSFFFSLLISIGALAVSMGFAFFALLAKREYLCFDARRSEFVYGWNTVLHSYRKSVHRFDEITALKLEANTWSDGPTSYDLILHTQAGMKITFGDFASKDEAQRYHAILMDMTTQNI